MGAGANRRLPRVVLGKISSAFGVRGWLKVWSYTNPPAGIFDYPIWQVAPAGAACAHAMRVVSGRPHGKGLVVQLAGVDDRDAAQALAGNAIWVDREQLPQLESGEYYWVDLIGLSVQTQDGTVLGQVEKMLETGAHDVMVVAGERERLIPFVMGQVVKDVDLAEGRLVVDWDPDF